MGKDILSESFSRLKEAFLDHFDPPTMQKGRLASAILPTISRTTLTSAPWVTSTTAFASITSQSAAKISSGSAKTTGPGRPEHATLKALAIYSGIRSARSISATHFASGSNIFLYSIS